MNVKAQPNEPGFTEAHTKHADEIYTKLVNEAGLGGKAFFGHGTSKANRAELNRLWRRAQRIAVREAAPQPSAVLDEDPAYAKDLESIGMKLDAGEELTDEEKAFVESTMPIDDLLEVADDEAETLS